MPKIIHHLPVLRKSKEYSILFLLFFTMFLIHRYIFLYADDFYYSRDASYGLGYLPHFTLSELQMNGRVWIGLAMLGILKYDIYLFRVINPLIITLSALLLAKLSTYSEDDISSSLSTPKHSKFWIALLSASLFFLLLPIEIAHTTIYYAACAFNYLYPTVLVMLYAYLLYTSYTKEEVPASKKKYLLVILAFFAGESTQQIGMIAIGYTVLITFYFHLYKKKRVLKKFIPYYIALALGFSFVLYGSFHRLFFEKQMGNEVNPLDVMNGLLKINIFSRPAALFVLLLCISSLFWFKHFLLDKNKLADLNNTGHDLSKLMTFATKTLLILLTLGILGYIYVVLYKNYPVDLFEGGKFNTLLSIALILFSLVYLSSLLIVSWQIMKHEHYPFLFFGSINAIGAQLMLLAVNARFANAYKIMFPSLLIMSVFIIYSIVKFHKNKYFLVLSASAIFLTIAARTNQIVLIVPFLLGLLLLTRAKFFYKGMVVLFIGISLFIFGTNYLGYKEVSYPQAYNLRAIVDYHQDPAKDVLKLEKVPINLYGYNLGNWNEMPYFMKECYKISPTTIIEYQK